MRKSFNFEEFGLQALKATDSKIIRELIKITFSGMITVVEITTDGITLETELDDKKMELLIRTIDEQLGNFILTGDAENAANVFAKMAAGVSAAIKSKAPSEVDDDFNVKINDDGSGAIVISAKLADMPAMGDAVTKVAILNKVFTGNCYYFSLNKKGTRLKMLCEDNCEGNWKLFFGAINSCFTRENPEPFLKIMSKIELLSKKK